MDYEVIAQTPTHRALLIPDDDGISNPRDADNLGVMWTGNHLRYRLGDQPFRATIPEYEDAERAFGYYFGQANLPGQLRWRAFARYLRVVVGATQVLPLWLFDHSGLSMSASISPFDSGGWDSGLVGVIFDTPRTREMCGTPPDRIAEALGAEVVTYDQCLTGDVYGIRLETRHFEEAYAIHSILVDGSVVATLQGRTLDEAEAVAATFRALHPTAQVTVATREVPGTWTEWEEDEDGTTWGYFGHADAEREALGMFAPFEVAA